MISLPYNNELCVSTKYVFGHERINSSKLISHISVKEMMLKNKAVMAVASVSNTARESNWNAKEGQDVYIRMVAYMYACLEDTTTHCGDCICVSCSCITCMYESYYCEALGDISYFEDLLQIQPAEIKQILNKYDTIILLMTLMQMIQPYWDNFMVNYNNKVEDPNIDSCLRTFLSLTEGEQQEKYQRMVKVWEYVNNPIKIEGIPWW